MANWIWQCRQHTLAVHQRPLVMGIVNVTPDSFSDGGQHASTPQAIAWGLKLAEDGADILDVGGESTRPESEPVPLDEELQRVVPVVRALAGRLEIPISVDTSKAEVARQAIDAGASIINDVTGLRGDPAMTELARHTGAGVVVMHMLGTPQTMQNDPQYDDVVAEIGEFFTQRLEELLEAGLHSTQIVIDPGIGFGKRTHHTLAQLARLGEYRRFDRPILLGVSRKGFIGKLCERDLPDRVAGSLAIACFAMAEGSAQIFRVHDVKEHRDAALLFAAIQASKGERCL